MGQGGRIVDFFLLGRPLAEASGQDPGGPRARRLETLLEVLLVALLGLSLAWSFFPPALDPLGEGALTADTFLPGPDGPWALVGRGIDLSGTLWTFDYVARLTSGEVGLLDGSMFSPLGFDTPSTQGCAWADAYMALPLVALFGAPSAYNLYVLLLLSGGFAAAYALFRGFSAPPVLALPLAAIAIDNPFVAKELYQGRPTQVHLLFHLLFLLLIARLLRDPGLGPDGGRRFGPGLRDAVLAGVTLALACLVYWFGGMAVGILGAVTVLFVLLRDRRRDLLVNGVVLSGVALATALLASWPVVTRWLSGASLPGMDAAGGERLRVGPIRFAVGSTRYQVDGLQALWETFRDLGLPPSAVLAFVVSLSALAIPAARRRVLPWILGTLFVASLPLGGAVYVGPLGGKVPTAFALVLNLFPPLQRCHFPERLLVAPLLGMLCVAAVAAGALPRKRWIPLLFGALLLFARQLDAPVWAPTGGAALPDAPFYRRVAEELHSGIVDVPLSASNNDYAYQLVHRQRLLGGMGFSSPNTRPPGYDAYLRDNTFLAAMESLAQAPAVEVLWRTADVDQLYVDGFGVVIIHLQDVVNPGVFLEYLGEPTLVDPRYAAFHLPSPSSAYPGNVTATRAR